MSQLLQLIGALPVVITYYMSLLGKLNSQSPTPLALNAGEAGLLAYVSHSSATTGVPPGRRHLGDDLSGLLCRQDSCWWRCGLSAPRADCTITEPDDY